MSYVEIEVEESATSSSDNSPDTDAPEIPWDGKLKDRAGKAISGESSRRTEKHEVAVEEIEAVDDRKSKMTYIEVEIEESLSYASASEGDASPDTKKGEIAKEGGTEQSPELTTDTEMKIVEEVSTTKGETILFTEDKLKSEAEKAEEHISLEKVDDVEGIIKSKTVTTVSSSKVVTSGFEDQKHVIADRISSRVSEPLEYTQTIESSVLSETTEETIVTDVRQVVESSDASKTTLTSETESPDKKDAADDKISPETMEITSTVTISADEQKVINLEKEIPEPSPSPDQEHKVITTAEKSDEEKDVKGKETPETPGSVPHVSKGIGVTEVHEKLSKFDSSDLGSQESTVSSVKSVAGGEPTEVIIKTVTKTITSTLGDVHADLSERESIDRDENVEIVETVTKVIDSASRQEEMPKTPEATVSEETQDQMEEEPGSETTSKEDSDLASVESHGIRDLITATMSKTLTAIFPDVADRFEDIEHESMRPADLKDGGFQRVQQKTTVTKVVESEKRDEESGDRSPGLAEKSDTKEAVPKSADGESIETVTTVTKTITRSPTASGSKEGADESTQIIRETKTVTGVSEAKEEKTSDDTDSSIAMIKEITIGKETVLASPEIKTLETTAEKSLLDHETKELEEEYVKTVQQTVTMVTKSDVLKPEDEVLRVSKEKEELEASDKHLKSPRDRSPDSTEKDSSDVITVKSVEGEDIKEAITTAVSKTVLGSSLEDVTQLQDEGILEQTIEEPDGSITIVKQVKTITKVTDSAAEDEVEFLQTQTDFVVTSPAESVISDSHDMDSSKTVTTSKTIDGRGFTETVTTVTEMISTSSPEIVAAKSGKSSEVREVDETIIERGGFVKEKVSELDSKESSETRTVTKSRDDGSVEEVVTTTVTRTITVPSTDVDTDVPEGFDDLVPTEDHDADVKVVRTVRTVTKVIDSSMEKEMASESPDEKDTEGTSSKKHSDGGLTKVGDGGEVGEVVVTKITKTISSEASDQLEEKIESDGGEIRVVKTITTVTEMKDSEPDEAMLSKLLQGKDHEVKQCVEGISDDGTQESSQTIRTEFMDDEDGKEVVVRTVTKTITTTSTDEAGQLHDSKHETSEGHDGEVRTVTVVKTVTESSGSAPDEAVTATISQEVHEETTDKSIPETSTKTTVTKSIDSGDVQEVVTTTVTKTISSVSGDHDDLHHDIGSATTEDPSGETKTVKTVRTVTEVKDTSPDEKMIRQVSQEKKVTDGDKIHKDVSSDKSMVRESLERIKSDDDGEVVVTSVTTTYSTVSADDGVNASTVDHLDETQSVKVVKTVTEVKEFPTDEDISTKDTQTLPVKDDELKLSKDVTSDQSTARETTKTTVTQSADGGDIEEVVVTTVTKTYSSVSSDQPDMRQEVGESKMDHEGELKIVKTITQVKEDSSDTHVFTQGSDEREASEIVSRVIKDSSSDKGAARETSTTTITQCEDDGEIEEVVVTMVTKTYSSVSSDQPDMRQEVGESKMDHDGEIKIVKTITQVKEDSSDAHVFTQDSEEREASEMESRVIKDSSSGKGTARETSTTTITQCEDDGEIEEVVVTTVTKTYSSVSSDQPDMRQEVGESKMDQDGEIKIVKTITQVKEDSSDAHVFTQDSEEREASERESRVIKDSSSNKGTARETSTKTITHSEDGGEIEEVVVRTVTTTYSTIPPDQADIRHDTDESTVDHAGESKIVKTIREVRDYQSDPQDSQQREVSEIESRVVKDSSSDQSTTQETSTTVTQSADGGEVKETVVTTVTKTFHTVSGDEADKLAEPDSEMTDSDGVTRIVKTVTKVIGSSPETTSQITEMMVCDDATESVRSQSSATDGESLKSGETMTVKKPIPDGQDAEIITKTVTSTILHSSSDEAYDEEESVRVVKEIRTVTKMVGDTESEGSHKIISDDEVEADGEETKTSVIKKVFRTSEGFSEEAAEEEVLKTTKTVSSTKAAEGSRSISESLNTVTEEIETKESKTSERSHQTEVREKLTKMASGVDSYEKVEEMRSTEEVTTGVSEREEFSKIESMSTESKLVDDTHVRDGSSHQITKERTFSMTSSEMSESKEESVSSEEKSSTRIVTTTVPVTKEIVTEEVVQDEHEESPRRTSKKREPRIVKRKIIVYHTGSDESGEDLLTDEKIREAIMGSGVKSSSSVTRIVSSGTTEDMEKFAGEENVIEIKSVSESSVSEKHETTSTESSSTRHATTTETSEGDPFSLITKPLEETFKTRMREHREEESSESTRSESKSKTEISEETFSREVLQETGSPAKFKDSKVATDAKKLVMESVHSEEETREVAHSSTSQTTTVVEATTSTTTGDSEEERDDRPSTAAPKSFRLDEWDKPMGLPSPPDPPAFGEDVESLAKHSTTTSKAKQDNGLSSNPEREGSGDQEEGSPARSDDEGAEKGCDESEGKAGTRPADNKEAEGSQEPVYIDLTYVPHFGDPHYCNADFFRRVRSRYYVFSGSKPSKEVFNALLEAKQDWKDKDAKVTIIPTYETDTLGYWMAVNQEALVANNIDVAPSASRCTINLQDHETSCSAYRLEL